MAQRSNCSWCEGIERDVAGALYEEVSKNVPGIFSVDVDLTNGDILIVRNDLLVPASSTEVLSLAEEAGARLKLKHQLWDYHVRRKPTTPFISHIKYQPLWRRFGRSPSKLSRFDISLSDMQALHEAVTELMALSARMDVIATFAAGGVSVLEHVAERLWNWRAPVHPLNYDRELCAFSQRYHLFPGLNWMQEGNKTEFDTWLAGQTSGSKVLIFDTGTREHGVRQIVKRVNALAIGGAPFGPSFVKVVGLVDGYDNAQKDNVFTTQKGDASPFVLDVSYHRVPRVLTEDCDVLRGCEVDLTRNCLVPVKDPGQIRLFTETGRLAARITSSSIASQYRSMMILPPRPTGLVQCTGPLTPESERDAVKKVLEESMRDEASRLHQAWCMEFLSDHCYSREKSGMLRRYDQALDRYSKEAWDFAAKKYVAT
jgi:hypothetical protein